MLPSNCTGYMLGPEQLSRQRDTSNLAQQAALTYQGHSTARQHWSMLSSGGVALVSQCCLLDNIGCVPLPGQPLWPRRYPVILPSPNGIHYQATMLLLPPPKQGEERTLTNIALGPTALGQYQSMFSPHPVLGGVIMIHCGQPLKPPMWINHSLKVKIDLH